uniref:ZP domain-containing protein n=1 Tax=Angiostrongylus cantonensis TaxID=6313 RepID=A0A0K0DQL1_ANGCA
NDAGSYSVDFVVATNDCGIIRVPSVTPAGHNYSLILHLKHHDSLRTSDDRAYLLQCFIGKQLDSSELTLFFRELMIAETISLSSVPPTCAYSIRRDSPDGAIIHNAFVGQTVYHRWECDGGEEANKVYGIQIHNCHASDDVDEKFPIVDSKGCSTDLSLLSDPKYDDNRLAAYSESKAFAFEGADLLKFVCKLSLCTRDEDGCEGVTPPTCDDSNTSDLLVTRRFRHYSTAMEGALSSALSTKVGMAMNRPSTLQDPASSVIAIVLLIAIIATGKSSDCSASLFMKHCISSRSSEMT